MYPLWLQHSIFSLVLLSIHFSVQNTSPCLSHEVGALAARTSTKVSCLLEPKKRAAHRLPESSSLFQILHSSLARHAATCSGE